MFATATNLEYFKVPYEGLPARVGVNDVVREAKETVIPRDDLQAAFENLDIAYIPVADGAFFKGTEAQAFLVHDALNSNLKVENSALPTIQKSQVKVVDFMMADFRRAHAAEIHLPGVKMTFGRAASAPSLQMTNAPALQLAA